MYPWRHWDTLATAIPWNGSHHIPDYYISITLFYACNKIYIPLKYVKSTQGCCEAPMTHRVLLMLLRQTLHWKKINGSARDDWHSAARWVTPPWLTAHSLALKGGQTAQKRRRRREKNNKNMPVSMATHTQKKNQNSSGVRKGFLRKRRVEKPVAVMRITSARLTFWDLRVYTWGWCSVCTKKDKEHCGNV